MSVSLSVFPSSRKNINPYLVLFSPAPLFNNGGGWEADYKANHL